MLAALKEFFTSKVAPSAEVSPEAGEKALRLAAGVLLFEVVRADHTVEASERTVMTASLQSTFDLSADEAAEIMNLAEQQSRAATSLYEFTSLLDSAFSPDQKKRVIELLWLVAFADGTKTAEEEQMVRKISGLLHVAHPDFINAKLKAKSPKGD